MSDQEKYSWAVVLLTAWAFPILINVLTVFFGPTPEPAGAMHSMGVLSVILSSVWALTLAFRAVYLSGKRKGNQ